MTRDDLKVTEGKRFSVTVPALGEVTYTHAEDPAEL
jgi:hypothetical protein